MKFGLAFLVPPLLGHLLAADEVAPVIVDVTIRAPSLFVDRSAEAVAHFDLVVEQPEDTPEGTAECSVLDVETSASGSTTPGHSEVAIRFMPRKVGLVTLPSLEFRAGDTIYQTRPMRMMVGQPERSPAMSLRLVPEKTRIYVGEPLRIDLTWDCSLQTGALKELDLNPAFFTEQGVEIVVPRNTVEETRQAGIPIGGRRVIATRTPNPDRKEELGRIELPLYLRFSEPGKRRLAETRLECAVLSEAKDGFGRYAAYFNNSLFEPVEPDDRYQLLYTESSATEIEVLPLPAEGRNAEFTGWFAPLKIGVAVKPMEAEIGQLMELEIRLKGKTPHGMLELPPLSRQKGLRDRFLVDEESSPLWQADGTVFRARMRVLSTSVRALPSLTFQIFDPRKGTYQMLTTDPVSLNMKPSKGRDFIPLKSYAGAAVVATDQPGGIWANLNASSMNDVINELLLLANRFFIPLLLLGTLVFFACLPRLRDRRRRAIDTRYRLRAEAFAAFQKIPENSAEKWPAFLHFMAASFGSADGTWTSGDSVRALESVGASPEEISRVSEMHAAADARDFSRANPGTRFGGLDGVARHVFALLKNGMLPTLLLIGCLSWTNVARASDWDDAARRFDEAKSSPAGSEEALELFTDAALKFQAAAVAQDHAGEAWYNAGNAWFEAGAIGRSIAAYRQARLLRPFDSKIIANLTTSRAMTRDEVPPAVKWWDSLPPFWLRPALLKASFLFWIALGFYFRRRGRRWMATTAVAGMVWVVASILLVRATCFKFPEGVVIEDAVLARKGPGLAYTAAFNEPLHDGLEFRLVETRGDWSLVELQDLRQCWLPTSQIQLISDPGK
jgi:tetratricopeptide (TPR) repeat protein